MRGFIFLLGCLFAFPTISAAQAEPDVPVSERDDEARIAYDAAATAYEDGQMELALSLFERAYELSPRPELLYNIATAAERVGNQERAAEAYELFVTELPDSDRAEFARGRLAELSTTGQESDSGGFGAVGWLGVGLGVAGLGLATTAVIGLATASGCASENEAGVCTEETIPAVGPTVGFGAAGGALLITGVILVLLGLGSESSEAGLAVGVGPQGAQLGGRW